ncbi:MAG: glycosyltransferase family 87 protein [Gemmataceae bacterium]
MTAWLRLLPFPLVGLALMAVRPDVFPPKDFPEYWAAAVVFATGGDPYDGTQLLPVQRTVMGDHIHQATSLWTPPWTLPLYLPLGFLPFTVARFVWIGLQLAMVFAAVELLWWTYRGISAPAGRGEDRLWFLPHLLALLFAPVFWLTLFGQNTAFLLLGLAGFLHFRDTRPYLAGCFTALTAIKPHLLAVFGVLLILDVFRRDGWKVLLAGVGTLVAFSLVSLAVHRDIFDLFVAAVRRPATPETVPLSEWDLPLIAHKLRHAIDPHRFWIQFVPCGMACGVMAGYKLRLGRRWCWRAQLPWVVLVSCLCAPYGGWVFDLVVLLVPVVAGAAGLMGTKTRGRPSLVLGESPFPFWPIALLLGYLLVSLWGFLIPSLQEPIWFTPAVTALFVGVRVCPDRGSPGAQASSATCTDPAVS